ncbi:MAG TPA: histidine triad nucleotide-binding protein [Myxococcales bacterium]|jgi:histidine triad (HIT) family protein
MDACIFCLIRDGKIPAKRVYEDDQAVAFEDTNPQAPTHVLVIPRKHVSSLNELEPADEALVGHLFSVGRKIAQERGIHGTGWRAVINTNRDAGQTVFHIHLHVLGGRSMRWPPG